MIQIWLWRNHECKQRWSANITASVFCIFKKLDTTRVKFWTANSFAVTDWKANEKLSRGQTRGRSEFSCKTMEGYSTIAYTKKRLPK